MKAPLTALLAAAALLVTAVPAAAFPFVPPEGRRITVIFRFDDYSATSDTELETRILRAFRARNLRCTFGVIPSIAARSVYDPGPQGQIPLPAGKIEILREALRDGTLEVAQHGTSHQAVRLKIAGSLLERLGRHPFEFFGVGRARQKERIARGKKILEDALQVRVETFIPPWNGYDWNTLSVLEELGFRNFSAARSGVILLTSSLRYLPRTCDLADLRDAVESARRVEDPAPIIVVLFHHYDFRESRAPEARLDFLSFEKILDWIPEQPDVRVLTLGEAAGSIPDLGAERFWWNRNALLWQITPPFPNEYLPPNSRPLYLSTPFARSTKMHLWALVLPSFLLVAIVSAGIARLGLRILAPRFPRASRWAARAAPAGLLAVLVLASREGGPHAGDATAFFCMTGICAGSWRASRQGAGNPEIGSLDR